MKKITLLSVIIFSAFYMNAQSGQLVEDGLFKANLLAPGVSYELGIGAKTTLNLEAFLGFALNGGSGRDTNFGLYPGLEADVRQYINFDRRLRKGKNISGNTGNYISFLNQFQFGTPIIGDLEYTSDYYYNAALVYGLQRTYKKGFYFSLAFGPGVFVNEFNTDAGILIDARLGWVIGGRKK
ncbi:hypothetical protein CLV90_1221 [Maribacter spongiicola]|uniref:Outer membrane protein with beta-barrel domain n=1 Tax=Maribacter spongiicola TaxID=1206753 RepID=A0A4R7K880_9FLAO|nr:hypothetical protein [Maribacter spongiicola]TDT47149.1 hypothetical protein CLV90_1221 [Maribacter spongiicola]